MFFDADVWQSNGAGWHALAPDAAPLRFAVRVKRLSGGTGESTTMTESSYRLPLVRSLAQ
jgi:hypothetical protein